MKSKLEYMIDIVKKNTKYYKYLTNNEKKSLSGCRKTPFGFLKKVFDNL